MRSVFTAIESTQVARPLVQLAARLALLFLCASVPLAVAGDAAAVLEQIRTSGTTLRGMHDTLGSPQVSGFASLPNLYNTVSPPLWSGDFGFSLSSQDWVDDIAKRGAQLAKMLALGRQGKLLTLSWHQCNPRMGEPCTFKAGVQTPLTEHEWVDLLTEGTALHAKWAQQVGVLAGALRRLQSEHIVVLLRPYHEANIPGMWWYSATPARPIKLWAQLRRELTHGHKLDNLVWVWAVAYHPKYWTNVASYYPGDAAVDIVGVDIYPPAKGVEPPFAVAWETLKRLAPDKPLALTEVSALPSARELAERKWAYAVPWGINLLQSANSAAAIGEFYNSSEMSR